MEILYTKNVGLIAARQIILDAICHELHRYSSIRSAMDESELDDFLHSLPLQILEETQSEQLPCLEPLFHVCSCTLKLHDIKENFRILSSDEPIARCLLILEMIEDKIGSELMEKLLWEGLKFFREEVHSISNGEIVANVVYGGDKESMWFNSSGVSQQEMEDFLYDVYGVLICTSERYVKGVA